ncbi:MAG: hypothetical protein AB1611_05905 [bacterium]
MIQYTAMKSTVAKNKSLILSSLLFVLLLGLFCLVNKNLEEYSPSTIQLANRMTAGMVSATLNLLRIRSGLSESTISISQGGALEIIYECTGIYIFLIFTAFVLSYPALIRQKLLGLAIFIPILGFFNVLRIVSLAMIQLHWPQYLDLVHRYLWEATFMVLVMVMVYLWLLWIDGQLGSRLRQGKGILPATVKFILFSGLSYGILMAVFRVYLFLLQGLVNAALSISWRYWLDYWPLRLAVEQNDLWLIYARGKMQIQDIPFIIPNLIPFISLMLVSKLRPRVKVLGIMAGSMVLFGYHAFTLILVIQKMARRWLYLYTFFRVYLLFLLPVMLWAVFFFPFREKENQEAALPGQQTSSTRVKGQQKHPAQAHPLSRKGLPGDTAGWKAVYALLGVILPLVILLLGQAPGPGYFLGFFLWLTGLVLVLPQSAFLSEAQGRKRTARLILLYVLFWQGPITANSLIYVPEGQRALFLTSDRQPASCGEQGFYLGFYLAQKPVLFTVQDRKIVVEIRAELTKETRPLMAVDLEVLYRLSRTSDLARIYTDLGCSMETVDQALVTRIRQRIQTDIQGYLPLILAGRLGVSRIRSLLTEAVEKSVLPYRIEIKNLKIVNQGNPRISL